MGTVQKQWQYCSTVECTARRSRKCTAVSCQAVVFVSCGAVILYLFPHAHHGVKPFSLLHKHTWQRRGRNNGGLFLFSAAHQWEQVPSSFLSLHFLLQKTTLCTLADNKSLFNRHLRRQQSSWHDSGASLCSSGSARVRRFNYTQLLSLAGSAAATGDTFNATSPSVKWNRLEWCHSFTSMSQLLY